MDVVILVTQFPSFPVMYAFSAYHCNSCQLDEGIMSCLVSCLQIIPSLSLQFLHAQWSPPADHGQLDEIVYVLISIQMQCTLYTLIVVMDTRSGIRCCGCTRQISGLTRFNFYCRFPTLHIAQWLGNANVALVQ